MADRFDAFQELGVAGLAVSMSRPDGLNRYLAASRAWPFPIVADPERTAYAALGVGRTSWGRLLRPGIIGRYLKLIVRGARVRRIPEGEDALQQGGDFLVSPDRRVLWAHTGPDPTDRPSVDELLREARRAVDSARP